MTFKEYDQYDGLGLAALVKTKQVTAREVLEAAISQAEALNPSLNFLTHKAYDLARAAADDRNLPHGPLHGVPWLVKELATAWAGQPYTNCVPYLKDVIAPLRSRNA